MCRLVVGDVLLKRPAGPSYIIPVPLLLALVTAVHAWDRKPWTRTRQLPSPKETNGGLISIDQPLPDIIAPNLKMLIVGINPSIASAECGHQYAGKGNGFWRALHEAGITDRVLYYTEDRSLLNLGIGSTNLVDRPTRGSNDLQDVAELRAGLATVEAKVEIFAPATVILLCKSTYNRAAPAERRVPGGLWGGMPWPLGAAEVHVLPNPSGRNNGRRPTLVAGLRTAWLRQARNREPKAAPPD